ncbi:MAG: hypothetical protein WAL36_01505 [Pseudolabrys sp.]
MNEVESTNLAVKELDEAAGRIGDVIKLITDIAEPDQSASVECDD